MPNALHTMPTRRPRTLAGVSLLVLVALALSSGVGSEQWGAAPRTGTTDLGAHRLVIARPVQQLVRTIRRQNLVPALASFSASARTLRAAPRALVWAGAINPLAPERVREALLSTPPPAC